MFVGRMEPNEKLYRRSYIDASCQDWFNIKPNLAGNIYVRSPIMLLHLVPFGQKIWLPRAVLVSDWLMLKNSSPEKICLTVANQKQELLLAAIFVGQTERNEETL
jgi:hypothetical protein